MTHRLSQYEQNPYERKRQPKMHSVHSQRLFSTSFTISIRVQFPSPLVVASEWIPFADTGRFPALTTLAASVGKMSFSST
jgi:hypothetical protein